MVGAEDDFDGLIARAAESLDDIVSTIVRERRDGDLVVMMSNGGFGGIHRTLLDALAPSEPSTSRGRVEGPAPSEPPTSRGRVEGPAPSEPSTSRGRVEG